MIDIKHRRLQDEAEIPDALIATRGLRRISDAIDLVIAEVGEDGKEYLLIPEAADAWRRMKHAAAQDGIHISIISAFRSVERQAEIVRQKLQAGESLEQILKVSAPPGYSEHHSGCAVDITTPDAEKLSIDFGDTPAFRWLQRRAAEFHFILSYPPANPQGYMYEPWHWCYRAKTESFSSANP